MFPFWFVLGIVMILLGMFNRQILQFLGMKPMSEAFTASSLKQSTRTVEKIVQWLVIVLGLSFIVRGLGETLPTDLSYKLSFSLLGLSGLMILAVIGITVANWKAQ